MISSVPELSRADCVCRDVPEHLRIAQFVARAQPVFAAQVEAGKPLDLPEVADVVRRIVAIGTEGEDAFDTSDAARAAHQPGCPFSGTQAPG